MGQPLKLLHIHWKIIASAALAAGSVFAAEPVIRPKVVVVTYFEVGEDVGDQPGELQFWVERDRLERKIEVPGMTRPVRVNATGTEIAVAVGPGSIKPAVNLMALGADSRFDLRASHWLINGIAGISPRDGTIGSAVWTDFVVNGDLVKELDGRELPAGWPDGFVTLDGGSPKDPKGGERWEDDVRLWQGADARANRRGNVIRLNQTLVRQAMALTKDMALAEDDQMRTLRLRYTGFAGTKTGPKVMRGANLSTEVFWHGEKLDSWAHRWVAFETDGVAKFGTTAMNDSGALLALEALTKQGKAQWNNVLLLRTASNFDMPAPGTTAAENLAREQKGSYSAYLPALEAAYRVGRKMVEEWLK